MDARLWFYLIIGGVVALALLCWSVQSLLQARLIAGWRRPSLDGLHDHAVAVYGDVEVREPLEISPLGSCLWHREIVTVRRGKSSRTESDEAEIAKFFLKTHGREIHVVDVPTEVHGGESETDKDELELGHLFFSERRTYEQRWLPVVGHLTVVGRIRRTGGRWEIARDPMAGLLFSTLHPMLTAGREYLKGGFGLAGAVATLLAILWAYASFR